MTEERAMTVPAPLSTPDVFKIAEVMAKSGYFKDAKDMAKAAVKIMAGQELGIGPVASQKGIQIIADNVQISANLMAALVKRSGQYNYKILEATDARCCVEFYEAGKAVGTSSFTIEEAKKAGVRNLDKYPSDMLFARAMSRGFRRYTPDLGSGMHLYVPGEIVAEAAEVIETEAGETVNTETGEVLNPYPNPEPRPHMIPTLKKWTAEKGIPWPHFVSSLKHHHPDLVPEEEALDLLTEDEVRPLLIDFRARHPEYFGDKKAPNGAKEPETAQEAPQTPTPSPDPDSGANPQPSASGTAEGVLFPHADDDESIQARQRFDHLRTTATAHNIPWLSKGEVCLHRLIGELWPDRGDTDIWRMPIEVYDRVDARMTEIVAARKEKG